MTKPRALRLNSADNVIIAVDEIPAGVAPAAGVDGARTHPQRA